MNWATMGEHRATGPVFYDVHDNERVPRQKCSCGSWFSVEHVEKLAHTMSRPDESAEPLF
jgi:hypothetical protein